VRGILREFGITVPVGARKVVPKVTSQLQDPSSIVPSVVRPILESVCAEIRELEQRIRAVERQLRDLARDMPAVQRLMTIPGIGLLTATALVAFTDCRLRSQDVTIARATLAGNCFVKARGDDDSVLTDARTSR